MRFPFWLLVFLRSHADGCDSGADSVAHSIALRFMDAFISFVPIPGLGALTTPFWALYDMKQTSNVICYVEKYLRKYHTDNVYSQLELFAEKMKNGENDPIEVERILRLFENPTNKRLIHQPDANIRAAVFPFILPWATFHMAIYEVLLEHDKRINFRNRQARRKKANENWYTTFLYNVGIWKEKSTQDLRAFKGDKLKEMQAEQADWYTKKLLQYYRPHRDMIMKGKTKGNTRKDELQRISQSANDFVKTERVKNVLDVTGGKFDELVNSCIIRSGDTVALKKRCHYSYSYPQGTRCNNEDEGWLGCGKSGTCDSTRSCPGKYMTFDSENGEFHCFGEEFWIHSDDNPINVGSVVNIKYDIGQWLSFYSSYSINRRGFNTKTCPGESFTGIKARTNWNCNSENLKIWTEKCKHTLCNRDLVAAFSDGDFFGFSYGMTGEFEIFKKNSACSQ
eukprot:GFUD01019127.1.p1 GENE.GFUD01019127.1~~GFUD01019127.1.p1  ORF type:complete len:452 (+),score=58.87 GFUD01019127.1:46-1401(+)